MNTIEQTVEAKNGAVDLHVDIPTEWEGYVLKITVERTESRIEKREVVGMSRFRGALRHLTPEQHVDIDRQLNELRNEWERPIF